MVYNLTASYVTLAFDPLYRLLTPLKYHLFEHFMENGAFSQKEQMLHFP